MNVEDLKPTAGNGDDEDRVLADLPDTDLVEQMHDDLYDGLR